MQSKSKGKSAVKATPQEGDGNSNSNSNSKPSAQEPSVPEGKLSEAGRLDAGVDSTWIAFDADSLDVDEGFHDLIRQQAERFRKKPSGTLTVSGYAHPKENRESAVTLSLERTEAVADLLKGYGVQSHRIVRVGQAGLPADKPESGGNWCVEIRSGGAERRQTVWSQRTKRPAKRSEPLEPVGAVAGAGVPAKSQTSSSS